MNMDKAFKPPQPKGPRRRGRTLNSNRKRLMIGKRRKSKLVTVIKKGRRHGKTPYSPRMRKVQQTRY